MTVQGKMEGQGELSLLIVCAFFFFLTRYRDHFIYLFQLWTLKI